VEDQLVSSKELRVAPDEALVWVKEEHLDTLLALNTKLSQY
jgi:hypothetical protein